jgi:hypothetical protein
LGQEGDEVSAAAFIARRRTKYGIVGTTAKAIARWVTQAVRNLAMDMYDAGSRANA